MSEKSISYLERKTTSEIPSLLAFKQRMRHILLNNRYIATFGGNFWNENGKYLQYMISAITVPNITIDNENVYIGGAAMAVPNGFQQGNVDLTVYNTGPELHVMEKWLAATYNQTTRSYGYYDDIKGDLTIKQYTTNGTLIQQFTFFDCTIFQLNGISFSYEAATSPQTFNVSLNYFGFEIWTNESFLEALAKTKFNQQIEPTQMNADLQDKRKMLQAARNPGL